MSHHNSSDANRETERAYHRMRIASSQNMRTIGDSILYDMSVLDSKSAALLQFISIVLVALTFALGFVDDRAAYAHWIRAGVFFFMACFAFAAWVDLRCLRAVSPARVVSLASEAEYEEVILQEIAQRREKYLKSLRITEATFILIIPFIIFWVFMTLHAAHPVL